MRRVFNTNANKNITGLQFVYDNRQFSPPFSLHGTTSGGINLTVRAANGQTVMTTGAAVEMFNQVISLGLRTVGFRSGNYRLVFELTGDGSADGTYSGEVISPRHVIPCGFYTDTLKIATSELIVSPATNQFAEVRLGANLSHHTTSNAATLKVEPGHNTYSSDCAGARAPVSSINSVPLRGGGLLLGSDLCHAVDPVIDVAVTDISLRPGQFTMTNDCTPCCDCEDYTLVHTAMKRVARENTAVSTAINDIARKFNALSSQINSIATERTRGGIALEINTLGECMIAVATSQLGTALTAVQPVTHTVSVMTPDGSNMRAVVPNNWSTTAIRRIGGLTRPDATITRTISDLSIPIGIIPLDQNAHVMFFIQVNEPQELVICLKSTHGDHVNPSENTLCRQVTNRCNVDFEATT
jgi:hypothetical protein